MEDWRIFGGLEDFWRIGGFLEDRRIFGGSEDLLVNYLVKIGGLEDFRRIGGFSEDWRIFGGLEDFWRIGGFLEFDRMIRAHAFLPFGETPRPRRPSSNEPTADDVWTGTWTNDAPLRPSERGRGGRRRVKRKGDAVGQGPGTDRIHRSEERGRVTV